jgi:L-seryl-tRNA(Ser) seleniumtransferase
LDKARLAALEQVLLLYLRPERLAETLPTLRLLTRSVAEIRETAERIGVTVTAVWPDRPVAVEKCQSQIGSGALPVDLLASYAVTISGKSLDVLATQLRALPRPVIGRLADGRLWLDCRCLEAANEAAFIAQLR